MKHPWITFTGMCAVVMGIVLFCVIFGGYSSLLRSQNRINTVKQMLTEQCAGQVRMASKLADLSPSGSPDGQAEALVASAKKLNAILIKMAASKDPLAPALIQEFESFQADLSHRIQEAISQLKTRPDLPEEKTAAMGREESETETSVLVMVRQYNKEARYFNTRSRQFPGALIAKIFSLDHIWFPEIKPPLQGESASAS